MSGAETQQTIGALETLADAAASDAAIPGPQARIGRYAVLRELGRGSTGVVLAAYDLELDRRVALKLLMHGGGEGSPLHERLRLEARALARVNHPNIVAVYDVGVFGGQVFVAMELVAGQALDQWCAARPRSWREVLAVFRQAGAGLAAAHAAGLVHRDFKPAPCNPASQPDAPSISKDLAVLQGAGLPRIAPRRPALPRSVAKIWQGTGPWASPASTPATWASLDTRDLDDTRNLGEPGRHPRPGRARPTPATWASPASTPRPGRATRELGEPGLDTRDLGELGLDLRAWHGPGGEGSAMIEVCRAMGDGR